MLATRISFMNELANLAEVLDADIEAVRLGIGSDPRIGPHFLYSGMGFGGSCFPKDVKALLKTSMDHGRTLHVLNAIETVNEAQKGVLFEKIARHFGGSDQLAGKAIALWGLSFKPNTDDMREAPSLVLIRQLLQAGCRVRAYDPVASEEALRILQAESAQSLRSGQLAIVASAAEAIGDADALVLVTEWKEFRAPDFDLLAKTLRGKAIFDGRNLYDPEIVRAAGLRYYGIGRRNPWREQ
jgi:UDPglucose 6-dehydrogenase